MTNAKNIVQNQRKYFHSQKTKSVAFRLEQLNRLEREIKKNEDIILSALKSDLNKSNFEAYATEIGLVYDEIKLMIKCLPSLAKRKKKRTPIAHFPAKSYVYQVPYGVALIISAWNYPFQLTMLPLIGAIAGGNCAVVKPSEYAVATSNVISKILSIFDDEYITVIEGGKEVSEELLEEKFDYIFYTGNEAVGKIVMQKASAHLTPVTLELGGKSPCIVDISAKVDLSAKRIVWGKLLNAGQTCVAPDYILIHEDIKEEFIISYKKYIHQFYGENPLLNEDYPKIISPRHFSRLVEIIKESDNVWGGEIDEESLKISPTIIEDASWESVAMKDEIFGPIMPIITYKDIDDIIIQINSRKAPLAVYSFTTSKEIENKLTTSLQFGGGCVNDTIIHTANPHISFGGLGNSGMGKYHGKESFYTFSHSKSILKRGLFPDINVRYFPCGDKIKLLRKLMK